MSNSTTPETTQVPTLFKKSDVMIKCSCGYEQIIEKAIEGGLVVNIPPTEDNGLTVKCGGCNTEISVFLVENKDEQDIQEENTSEESVQGLCGDNERETKVDIQGDASPSVIDGVTDSKEKSN